MVKNEMFILIFFYSSNYLRGYQGYEEWKDREDFNSRQMVKI